MSADRRRKNQVWYGANEDGSSTHDQAMRALLMDLRDELQELNRVFACQNFQEIPHILRKIRANTSKPKVKK